jgi:hypothetical protein
MLGTYFYHQIIRKNIIAFGTLFNNIEIHHSNVDGDISIMKVPLAYGPIQKYLARILQQPDLSKKGTLTLPRMSFEMTGLEYDPSRKSSITQSFVAVSSTNRLNKVYMPVPYNLKFQLNIMAKLNEDILEIIEQILPYFQPAFTITIDLVESIGEKKDTPIILNSIQQTSDNYEGNFDEVRVLIYTLGFTAKTNLFGPVVDSTDKLIKKVQVDFHDGTDIINSKRVLRYVATPKALQDYNNDNVINSADDALIPPGDDFGFNETTSFFQDYKTYSPSQQTDLDI